MSQNFFKEYWTARAISRYMFIAFILLIFVGAVTPLQFRGFIIQLGILLMVSMVSVPGIVVWRYPRFAQGWLSVRSSLLFASAPWDELSGFTKNLIYLLSIIGLVAGVIILCVDILNWPPVCEFFKGYSPTLNCG